MIIVSEITGKEYKTVNECLAAEAEYNRAQKEKEKAEAERKAKLEKAYDEAIAACEKYLDLAGIKVEFDEDEDEEDDTWAVIEALVRSMLD